MSARRPQAQPGALKLHSDNRTLVEQLAGRWKVADMQPLYAAAQGMIAALAVEHVTFEVVQVSETNKAFRRAHSLSKRAWEHILTVPEWRPARHPPQSENG